MTSEITKEAHTKDKVLDEALEDIVKTRKNAQGAVIVSHQGFIIASNMGKETFADPKMIVALCVEFVKTAQHISKKLFLGPFLFLYLWNGCIYWNNWNYWF